MNNPSIQTFESFFTMRSLSQSESEIHLVGSANRGTDYDRQDHAEAVMVELTAFVRSCLEALGEGHVEITQLGEGGCWSGIRVAVDNATRLPGRCGPRLHDTLAGWVRHLYPGIETIWRPR